MIEMQTLASSSKGNAYRITDGQTPLLLECGIAWKKLQAALRFKTSELSGCLLSHAHGDHSKAAMDVIEAGIDLHCSQGTADVLGISGHRVKCVGHGQEFSAGSWKIKAFDTEHDCKEPLGFLLANTAGDKLLFLTDSAYCPSFNGISHLMIEANYSRDILDRNVAAGRLDGARRKRVIQSHFSLEGVLDLLKDNDTSRLQRIILMHLSDLNSDEEMFKRRVQQLTGVPVSVA